mmetsp:Transcript_13092/g.17119  ORF Transcript_13092/g.17119 Transcript_13092/m.17119 type:complete len:523 (-) Transcript_13092:192-1760(-)
METRTISHLWNEAKNGEEPNYEPINSPRSLEACLRSGFDPEGLLPMSMEEFKNSHRGIPADILQMKFEHTEKRRIDRLKVVVRERENIVRYLEQREKDMAESPRSKSSLDTLNAVEKKARQMQQKSGDLERMRLEAIKRRQEKELARMVQNEQELVNLHKKIARGEEEEKKRQEEHEKKVQQARLAEMERRRQRALEKKQEEELELKKRREQARRDEARERKAKEKEEKEAAQRQLDARQREEERQRKREEYLRQKEEQEKAMEELAETNRLKMLERQANVKKAMEDKKAKRHEEMLEKRRRAEKRIQDTLDNNKKQQEHKKNEFLRRANDAAERAAEAAKNKEVEMEKQAKEREKKENEREKRLKEARDQRASRCRELMKKSRDKDESLRRVQEEKQKELMMKKIMNDLAADDRKKNVERIKRVDEFVRLQMLAKIQEQDERTDRLRRERDMLVDKRKEIARKMLLNKHRVMEAMDQMKVTNKFYAIDMDMDGKGKKKKKKGADDDDMDQTLGQYGSSGGF